MPQCRPNFKSNKPQRASLINGNKNYLLFDGLNTIGRHRQAIVNIANVNISQNHAVIAIIDANSHYISDLGSTNGTIVDGIRLAPLELHKINSDSQIEFGDVSFRYEKITIENCPNSENNAGLEPSQNFTQNFYHASTQAIDISTNKTENNQRNNALEPICQPFNIHDMETQIEEMEMSKLIDVHELPTQMDDLSDISDKQQVENKMEELVITDIGVADDLPDISSNQEIENQSEEADITEIGVAITQMDDLPNISNIQQIEIQAENMDITNTGVSIITEKIDETIQEPSALISINEENIIEETVYEEHERSNDSVEFFMADKPTQKQIESDGDSSQSEIAAPNISNTKRNNPLNSDETEKVDLLPRKRSIYELSSSTDSENEFDPITVRKSKNRKLSSDSDTDVENGNIPNTSVSININTTMNNSDFIPGTQDGVLEQNLPGFSGSKKVTTQSEDNKNHHTNKNNLHDLEETNVKKNELSGERKAIAKIEENENRQEISINREASTSKINLELDQEEISISTKKIAYINKEIGFDDVSIDRKASIQAEESENPQKIENLYCEASTSNGKFKFDLDQKEIISSEQMAYINKEDVSGDRKVLNNAATSDHPKKDDKLILEIENSNIENDFSNRNIPNKTNENFMKLTRPNKISDVSADRTATQTEEIDISTTSESQIKENDENVQHTDKFISMECNVSKQIETSPSIQKSKSNSIDISEEKQIAPIEENKNHQNTLHLETIDGASEGNYATILNEENENLYESSTQQIDEDHTYSRDEQAKTPIPNEENLNYDAPTQEIAINQSPRSRIETNLEHIFKIPALIETPYHPVDEENDRILLTQDVIGNLEGTNETKLISADKEKSVEKMIVKIMFNDEDEECQELLAGGETTNQDADAAMLLTQDVLENLTNNQPSNEDGVFAKPLYLGALFKKPRVEEKLQNLFDTQGIDEEIEIEKNFLLTQEVVENLEDKPQSTPKNVTKGKKNKIISKPIEDKLQEIFDTQASDPPEVDEQMLLTQDVLENLAGTSATTQLRNVKKPSGGEDKSKVKVTVGKKRKKSSASDGGDAGPSKRVISTRSSNKSVTIKNSPATKHNNNNISKSEVVLRSSRIKLNATTTEEPPQKNRRLSANSRIEKKKLETVQSTIIIERSKRQLKPKVVFTMMDNPQLETLIIRLGGSVVDTLQSATVLVTESVKRSQKLLAAVGQGKPICSPRWLQECKKSNHFLDPWDFILIDKEAENKWSFSLKESLNRSRNKKLMENYVFLNFVTTGADVLKGAIEACGGKYVTRYSKNIEGDFCIIAQPEHKSKYSKMVKQHPNVKVILPEAVFDGALRQELRFKDHLLS